MAGRSFPPVQRSTSVFDPNGLPLMDIPDAHVGSLESAGVWAVPDPVNPTMAAVLQLVPLDDSRPSTTDLPAADALWNAGRAIAAVAREGGLSVDYLIRWLNASFDAQQLNAVWRRIMDPAVRFHVPVFGAELGGWWIQISRRLIWVTDKTVNEGRLAELLFDTPTAEGMLPIAASEPILIVAPMTQQPMNWAFIARVWAKPVTRQVDRRWTAIAKAIHGSGIPTITVDSESTLDEVACQLLLKAYWHRYFDGTGPTLANALARAYPRQVDYIRRNTHPADSTAAAALLLEQLVQPGFDQALGAEAPAGTCAARRTSPSLSTARRRPRTATRGLRPESANATTTSSYRCLPRRSTAGTSSTTTRTSCVGSSSTSTRRTATAATEPSVQKTVIRRRERAPIDR